MLLPDVAPALGVQGFEPVIAKHNKTSNNTRLGSETSHNACPISNSLKAVPYFFVFKHLKRIEIKSFYVAVA